MTTVAVEIVASLVLLADRRAGTGIRGDLAPAAATGAGPWW